MTRDIQGHTVAANGRTVYVEVSGTGDDWVVFEAGGGCGRTCWDPVVALLTDRARLVTYDRAGRALSGPLTGPLSIDDMADDLVALVEAVVPGRFLLVAHSMGGLIARRAVERFGSRLRGLLLLDPTPETSPTYDNWDQTVKKTDRMLAVTQALTRFPPLARAFSGNLRAFYPADTYQTMLAEDFTPTGTARTRKEIQAVAAAVLQFRAEPPQPPTCPTTLLTAGRPEKGRETQNASAQERQRRYIEGLPNGRYERVDSNHLIQAEQPGTVVDQILALLSQ